MYIYIDKQQYGDSMICISWALVVDDPFWKGDDDFTRVHVTITLDAWVACFGEQDFMIEGAEMDVKNDETNNNGDRTQQNGDVNQQHLVSDYWNICLKTATVPSWSFRSFGSLGAASARSLRDKLLEGF